MKKGFKGLKAFLAIALSALAVIGLAGCGQKSSSDDANKKVTLNFTIWDTNQKKGMQQMAAAFTKKNPNIKVRVTVTPWDQYWTKLQAAASGDNLADVFWMHPSEVYTFAAGDKLMDLTDMTKNGGGINLKNYPSTVVSGLEYQNKVYALPKDYSTLALWYNKTLFDKAGVKYPDKTWTWDTWQEAAAKLTDKSKGVYGMLAPNDGQNFYWNLIWANGTDLTNKSGTKSIIGNKGNIDALNYGISFIKKGYSPTTQDFANTKPDQYFESGKAAMTIAGSWMPAEYLAVKNQKFGVAPIPKGKRRASDIAGMGYAIAKNTKHPAQAKKFVKFMAGKEANIIQAKSGAAIPAYKDTQAAWVKQFPSIDGQAFVDAADYGYSPVFTKAFQQWNTPYSTGIGDMFAGKTPVASGSKALQKQVQAKIDANK